jgi:hypothetical protein
MMDRQLTSLAARPVLCSLLVLSESLPLPLLLLPASSKSW